MKGIQTLDDLLCSLDNLIGFGQDMLNLQIKLGLWHLLSFDLALMFLHFIIITQPQNIIIYIILSCKKPPTPNPNPQPHKKTTPNQPQCTHSRKASSIFRLE
jgi:hypothetical protein